MTRRDLLRAGAAFAPASSFLFAAPATGSEWRSQGVLELAQSPYAKVRNIPVRAVRMGEGFWAPRRAVNVETSIPTMLQLLEEHGVVDNFLRLSGRSTAPRRGPLYTDSDLYKWMEAAAFVLQSGDDPKLRAACERLTGVILSAQESTGYLNTYWSGERTAQRFTQMDRGHELYCLGHMLQGAIAYYRATGDTKLLDGGTRFVDYLVRDFGPAKRPLLTGHPELEMALVELYRTTREKRYLELAGYLLHGDGERLHMTRAQYTYNFSGKPFTSRTILEGHAVRAMYACCGATDYYLETGDGEYRKTLETLWRDMVEHKMYVTGGVGSRAQGEAFGAAYELPNLLAYTESCAAIGSMMWNWRMLAATGEARFADVIERALYNGVNSGMSLAGNLYCYRNPLELTGDPSDRIRNPWYDTTCCPPNLERILASLPGYLYGAADNGIYVHFYHASTLDWHLADGAGLKLEQTTRYPWDGTVEITAEPTRDAEFTLYLRIPGWSSSAKAAVNGQPVSGAKPGEYLAIRRVWKRGDRVRLELPMEPRLVSANPRVSDDVGKVAVERGPLVYCLEGLDQNGAALADLAIAADPSKLHAGEFRSDVLGGIVEITAEGTTAARPSAGQPLYFPFGRAAGAGKTELTLIPYYTFSNREPTEMAVWVPYR